MSFAKTLGRAGFFSIALLLVAINSLSTRISASLKTNDGLGALVDLFGVNAVIWFALYAILRIGQDSGEREGISRVDVIIGLGMVVACLLPTQIPALAALAGGSLYLFLTSAKASNSRRIGVIALTLTGPLLWGSLALRLLGPELLAFDALLGAAFVGYSTLGNVIVTPTENIDLLVGPGCSAFRNVTLVFVLTASLSQLLDAPFDRRMAQWMAVAVACVIVINGLRLATLARFPEHFGYFHNGGGMVIFSYVTLLVTGLVIGIAIMRGTRDAS